MADLVTLFEPEAFFLAGGLADAGALIFQPTIRFMEENLLDYYQGKIKVLPSSLKTNEAAILGPASLVWKNQSMISTASSFFARFAGLAEVGTALRLDMTRKQCEPKWLQDK